jgi:hypothetical protein
MERQVQHKTRDRQSCRLMTVKEHCPGKEYNRMSQTSHIQGSSNNRRRSCCFPGIKHRPHREYIIGNKACPSGRRKGWRTIPVPFLLHENQGGDDGDNPIQQERQPCSRTSNSKTAPACADMPPLTMDLIPILVVSNKSKWCRHINSRFRKLTENISALL